MISSTVEQNIPRHPSAADINAKRSVAYRATRGMAHVVNALQMAMAEAHINGLEIPDPALRTVFRKYMPILFKHFPSLLVPYEWVLRETDHLAEGSKDLMRIQS